jgi:hypothetical protein
MQNNDAAKRIILIPTEFYVYTLADRAKVFYVGKGCGDRIYFHEQEARRECECHKCRKIRKIWRLGREVERYIVFRSEDEYKALEYESELIAQYGLGNLTNKIPGSTDGARETVTLYGKPDQISDDQYVEYLTRAGTPKKDIHKCLLRWRRDRWGRLKDARRYALCNKHDPALAEKIEAEMNALMMLINSMIDWDLVSD